MSIKEALQNLTLEDPTKVSIGDGDQYKNSAIRRRSLPNVNFVESKSKDVSTEGNITYFNPAMPDPEMSFFLHPLPEDIAKRSRKQTEKGMQYSLDVLSDNEIGCFQNYKEKLKV